MFFIFFSLSSFTDVHLTQCNWYDTKFKLRLTSKVITKIHGLHLKFIRELQDHAMTSNYNSRPPRIEVTICRWELAKGIDDNSSQKHDSKLKSRSTAVEL